MKKILKAAFAAIFVTALFSFSANPGNEDRAIVLVDGHEVLPDKEIIMEKDDTIELIALNLKPNSEIHFKIRKAGVRMKEDTFPVDEEGKVKGIWNLPEMRLTVTCLVDYYTAQDSYVETKFKFKVR